MCRNRGNMFPVSREPNTNWAVFKGTGHREQVVTMNDKGTGMMKRGT